MKTIRKKSGLIAVVILFTASLLVWPLYRGEAQKKNKTDSIKQDDGTAYNDDQDSAKHKRKYYGDGRADEQVRIAQQQVNKAMKQLEKAMKQMQKEDYSKIREQVSNALKSVDFNNIQVQVDEAMKNVDMAKVQVDINKAMANVDMKKIRIDVNKAMKEIDWAGMKKEIAEAMDGVKNINMDEVKKSMEETRIEIKKARIDIGNANGKIRRTKEMLGEMKKDGLINDGNHVNIQWKNGKLYINDKLQPDAVSDKYRKYLDEDSDMHINMNEDKNEDNDL